MPGRFRLTASPGAVAAHFALARLEPFPPRGEIAPTQPVLVVRGGEPHEQERGVARVAFLARWGLIPGWADDPATLPLLFAARAETAGERASFRGALRHRRCLLPATGFFARAPGTDPHRPRTLFRSRDDAPLAFAAIWEPFMAVDGSEIDTVALMTVAAGSPHREVADRVPAVIGPADMARWLDHRAYTPAQVADLLAPPEADLFEAETLPAAAARSAKREP